MILDKIKKQIPNKSLLLVVFISFLVGFIYFLPNIILNQHANLSSNLTYHAAVSDLDEAFAYGTQVKEVLDGGFWEGDPYLAEYKNMPNIWGSNLAAIFFGSILRLLGFDSIDPLFAFGDFIFSAILFLVLFKLFFTFTKNYIFSIFSSLTVILFPNFFIFKNLFTVFSFSTFLNIIGNAFNFGISRIFVPGFYLIFFFLFLLMVYRSAIEMKKTNIIYAGVLFGLLFYFYIYYWIFAFIFLSVLSLLFLILREPKGFLFSIKIFFIGLIVSLPFWIKFLYLKLLPFYADYEGRVGKEIFRNIRWQSLDLYIVVALMILIFWFLWRNKKNFISFYFISLLISVIAVLNLQVITGFNIQSDHWGSRVNVYIISMSLLLVLFFISKIIIKKLNKDLKNKLILYSQLILIVLIILLLNLGFTSQFLQASGKYYPYLITSDLDEAYKWLDNNTAKESVVASPYVYTNIYIPILTHNNVYTPLSCRSMASNEEVLFRFYEVNSAFKIKKDFIESVIKKERGELDDRLIDFEYGYFLFCETYYFSNIEAQHTKIPKFVANKVLNDYSKFEDKNKNFDFKFKADYLFYGPEEIKMGAVLPFENSRARLVFSNNSVKIYNISN